METANLDFDISGVTNSFLSLSCEKVGERFLQFEIQRSTGRKVDKYIKLIDRNSENPLPDVSESYTPENATTKMLPDGRVGQLTIRCGPTKISSSGKEIGTFSYHPAWTIGDDFEPECYLIYLDLPLESFEVIERLTVAGRCPSMIRISTPDIELTFTTDYRFLYQWDLEKTASVAKIVLARLEFSVSSIPVKIEHGEGSEHKFNAWADDEAGDRKAVVEAVGNIGEVANRLKNIELRLGTITRFIGLGLGLFFTFCLFHNGF